RINKAYARRRDASLIGRSFHLHAHQVVSEPDGPEFLMDSLGRSAPNRLLSVEHVGFDLVVAELSGKGLARYRVGPGPFPAPPLRNCTGGFPAYSSPSELRPKGYESCGSGRCFHAYESAPPRGWS